MVPTAVILSLSWLKAAGSIFKPEIAETMTALRASPRFASGCCPVVQTQERRIRPLFASLSFEITPAAGDVALRRNSRRAAPRPTETPILYRAHRKIRETRPFLARVTSPASRLVGTERING